MPSSMDSNRMNEVVARVVAWHNRHPLARRIAAAQVNSVGVVALPFATTAERSTRPLRADLIAPREVVEPSFAPPTLDEVVAPGPVDAVETIDEALAHATTLPEVRDETPSAVTVDTNHPESVVGKPSAKLDPRHLLAALRRLVWPGSRSGFQSIFSEDFVAPLSTQKVARWALQHGNTTRPGDADWPLREIAPDPALQSLALGVPGVEPVTLYLTAAAIDAPSGRLRVLLGRPVFGGTARVIGVRDLSPLRITVAGVLVTAALALAAWTGYWHGEPTPPLAAASASANVRAGAASQAPSAPASSLAPMTAAPASANAAAPSAPASSMAAAPTPVQRAASAPGVAAYARPASPAVPPTKAARAKPTSAPTSAPTAALATSATSATSAASAASAATAHTASLALEQHPALFDAPKTINEMAVALHNKSWIPESVKQAALLEGRRLRAEGAEAKAHPKPASPPASTPNDGSNSNALPGPVADKSSANTAAAVAAKPAAPGVSAAAAPQYYALVTKPSASKLEAEARMILLRAAATNAIAPRGTRIELLQTNQTWQAVWWPFPKREDAERAQHLLTVRGVLVEMVAF